MSNSIPKRLEALIILIFRWPIGFLAVSSRADYDFFSLASFSIYEPWEEGLELILRKDIITTQEATQENSINEMFSQQESDSSLVNPCSQPCQETSLTSDATSELISDIMAFLNTPISPLTAIKVDTEVSPESDDSRQIQPGQKSSRISRGRPITIFVPYVSADEKFRDLIDRELNTLLKQGCNITWDFYEVTTSMEFAIDPDNPLNIYDLILLLVSPDFVSSDFCYAPSMHQAVKRHRHGAWVSPVLLRRCRWERTPFGLEPVAILPRNKIPVAGWPSEDEAFYDISQGIEKAVEFLKGR